MSSEFTSGYRENPPQPLLPTDTDAPRVPLTDNLKRIGRRLLNYPDTGWLTVLLAYALAGSVVWSLDAAQWVPNLPGLIFITVTGALLGLVVAQARRGVLLPHIAVFAFGLMQAFVQTMLIVPGASIEGRLLTTVSRVVLWAQALLEGGASTDRLAFVLLLLFGGWLLSYMTVFLALRSASIWVVLPAGFVILSNLTYLPSSALVWLLLYLLAAALLLVRLIYLERSRAWRAARATPSRALSLHALHAGFWFAAIVFAITSVVPTIQAGPAFIKVAWTELRSPIGGAEGAFTRIFASLPARRSLSLYGFGGELPFRGNISLSDEIVMLVESDEPLYWRARTYDVYNSWGWENGPLVVDARRGLEDLAGSSFSTCPQCVRNITIDLRSPSATVYTAGTPLRTSLPVEALYLASEGAEGVRLVKLESQRVLQPNKRYIVQAFIPTVTEEDLHAQSDSYPRWMTEQFLALPDYFPLRLIRLAEAVTKGAQDPYDKVVGIRDFLRTYDYSQDIQAPPPGRDAVEFFLFGQKVGYSDYFGSAMVVLLRAVGVPARLAIGYATGDFDPDVNAYVVRESEAHAWAEVYFPDFGWLPFEPTPNRSALAPGGPRGVMTSSFSTLGLNTNAGGDLRGFTFEDPDLLDSFFDPDFTIAFDDGFGTGGFFIELVDALRIMGIALGIVLALLLVSGTLILWRRGLARPRTATQAYTQMVRLGRLGGMGIRGEETPKEYADRLARVLPSAGDAVRAIARAYGRSFYGAKETLPDDSFEWGVVVWRLLALALRRLVPRRGLRRRRLAYES